MIQAALWVNERDKSDIVYHSVKKLTLEVQGEKGKILKFVFKEDHGFLTVSQIEKA